MDASLKALGGVSRYQLLQVLVINVGVWGAVFQLLDNIFIGEFQSSLTGRLAGSLLSVQSIFFKL